MSQAYIAGKALEAAVDVAIELEMPLLLTGEPGTGKTQLAYWIASQKMGGSAKDVLRFNTKSNSVAKDLFYRYDAIRHFRDAQNKDGNAADINPLHYVTFEALGKAILAQGEKRYIVLVDEIDKASRDFPNDILFEFEEMAFRIEEATQKDFESANKSAGFWKNKTEISNLDLDSISPENGFIRYPNDHKIKKNQKPILILTSNSEKNLPDAFLRRCVYHHIEFPGNDDLAKIIEAHFPNIYSNTAREKMAAHFTNIRNKGLRKTPATAELVRWVEILKNRKLDIAAMNKAEAKPVAERSDDEKQLIEDMLVTYAVLAKNKDDIEKIKR